MSTWDILILDKSGSMAANIDKLVSGFNTLVEEQSKQGSNNKFTCIIFNTYTEILLEGFFPNIKKLNKQDIITSGTTALLDAIGMAYDLVLKSEHKNISITIVTDGMENSSKKYTKTDLDNIKNTIDNKNITLNITFIGADQDCLDNNPLNKHVSTNINYNGNVLSAMRSVSETISSSREQIQSDSQNEKNVQLYINKPLIPPKRSNTFTDNPAKKNKSDCKICTID